MKEHEPTHLSEVLTKALQDARIRDLGSFGAFIREERRLLGVTVEELSQLSGVSVATIRGYEAAVGMPVEPDETALRGALSELRRSILGSTYQSTSSSIAIGEDLPSGESWPEGFSPPDEE